MTRQDRKVVQFAVNLTIRFGLSDTIQYKRETERSKKKCLDIIERDVET